MAEVDDANSGPLRVSPRQLRIRWIAVTLLLIAGAMVAFGLLHPLFQVHPRAVDEAMRRRVALRAIFILGYWSVCFILANFVVLMAWLDVRETRRRFSAARRRAWRETLDRPADRQEGGTP